MTVSNKTVAFCGLIDPEAKTRLISFLEDQRARIVIWSEHVDILIVGDDYKKKFKYKSVKGSSTRIVPYRDIRLPVVQKDLWVDQYKPTDLSAVIGHKTQIDSILSWLNDWPKKDAPRAILVSGPPGIGKTTAVHLTIKHANFDIVELNASNERSASAVRKWFEEASHSNHVGKRRVVVMDEVDGMSSGDRGGIRELARIVKTCSFPIICIANERTTKLRPLTSCCLDIRFARPTRTTIAKTLMNTVIHSEKLSIQQSALELLCERNGNDIRSILNFLQFTSRSETSINMLNSTKDEIQRIDAFSATGRLFGGKDTIDSRMNLVFVDFGLVPLMVGEGYLGAASKSPGTDLDRLNRCIQAADYISDWDIFDTRIYKTQSWNLLPAAVVSIVSAAYSAQGPAPFQIFPLWLGKNSKRLKNQRNTRDMSRRGGFSTTMAFLDSIDSLRSHFFNCPSVEETIQQLDMYNFTRDDMMETMTDTVFTGFESSVTMDTKRKAAITREWKRTHSLEDSTLHLDSEDDAESVDIEEEL